MRLGDFGCILYTVMTTRLTGDNPATIEAVGKPHFLLAGAGDSSIWLPPPPLNIYEGKATIRIVVW